MELIKLKDNERLLLNEEVVAVIGQFDGLHSGHLKLIEAAKQKAAELHLKTALITFDPHPDFILGKRANLGYITPINEKLKLIEKLEIDKVIIIEFTKYLSELSPEKFYNNYLKSLTWIFAGSDYVFGHFGQGNIDSLKKRHKFVVGVEVLTYEDSKVSSNTIRSLISEGRVDEVYALMKRYYNITGKVTHGMKVGRTLGIRTANIELLGDYQIIKTGVYAVLVTIRNNKYLGVCNIGHNPTLNYIKQQRLEVHIIDFADNLYDETISVDFLKRLRDEIKYDNRQDLIGQINQDINNTKKEFRSLL